MADLCQGLHWRRWPAKLPSAPHVLCTLLSTSFIQRRCRILTSRLGWNVWSWTKGIRPQRLPRYRPRRTPFSCLMGVHHGSFSLSISCTCPRDKPVLWPYRYGEDGQRIGDAFVIGVAGESRRSSFRDHEAEAPSRRVCEREGESYKGLVKLLG